MVVLVGDDDAIELVVEGDARRPVELAGTRAVRAELAHELAALVEHLDAVVGAVGDDDVALLVAAHAPRPTELAVAAALAAAVDVEEHLAYLAVGARALDEHVEGAVEYVAAVDEYGDEIGAVEGRTVADRVGAVLLVDHVDAVHVLVRSLDVDADRVAADRAHLAQVVLGVDDERGELGLEALTQAVAVGDAEGRVRRARQEAHLRDGRVESGVGRREHQLVRLARLQQRHQLMVVVGVDGLEVRHLFEQLVARQLRVTATAAVVLVVLLLLLVLELLDTGVDAREDGLDLVHLASDGLDLARLDGLEVVEELLLARLQGAQVLRVRLAYVGGDLVRAALDARRDLHVLLEHGLEDLHDLRRVADQLVRGQLVCYAT